MKKLWLAVFLLGALAVGIFFHCRSVQMLSAAMVHLLEHAEMAVDEGEWEEAEWLAGEAAKCWEAKNGYLHVTMRHSDIDAINTGLAEARTMLRHREDGGFAAVNARLCEAVRKLYEMERLTLRNLL